MIGLTLGIDAMNIRVGGGVTHLTELFRAAVPAEHAFDEVNTLVEQWQAGEDEGGLFARQRMTLYRCIIQPPVRSAFCAM